MLGLEPDGCLVLIWGTNPLHEMFFFLKKHLNVLFDEVSMVGRFLDIFRDSVVFF